MAWTVDSAKSEEVALEEYVRKTFSRSSSYLPPNIQHIGPTQVLWFEPVKKVAVIVCKGGTIDDKRFAEELVALELGNFGYKKAQFTFDPDVTSDLRKEASWTDIMAKAKRLIQSGNVQLLRNGYTAVVAHVIGDHGEYNCEISRDDPTSRSITQWTCECPWDQYAWGRTRQFKKFEGRPCAHVLAAYWKSLSTPLDEDQPPPGQNSPFNAPPAKLPVPGQPGPGQEPMPSAPNPLQQVLEQGQPVLPPHIPSPTFGLPPQGQQPGRPGPNLAPGQLPLFQPDTLGLPPSQQIPLMAPMDNNVLPAFQEPEQAEQVLPVSVPGGRPGPYPGNPIQFPGGTFSHVAGAKDDFSTNVSVRLEEATYGEAEGPQGNGGFREIPKNSIGEVLGQDQTTGWVDCIFPLNDSGALEPYHVRAWIEPEKLTPMPNLRPFGPTRRGAKSPWEWGQQQMFTPPSGGGVPSGGWTGLKSPINLQREPMGETTLNNLADELAGRPAPAPVAPQRSGVVQCPECGGTSVSDEGEEWYCYNCSHMWDKKQGERLEPHDLAMAHTGQIPGDERLMGGVFVNQINPHRGINPSYIGEAWHNQDQIPVYIKPSGKFHLNDLSNERGAFWVGHHLGVPVPHTVIRNVDVPTHDALDLSGNTPLKSTPSQVQSAVPQSEQLAREHSYMTAGQAYPEDIRKIALLDNVIANTDRHLGNVVHNGVNAYPIDHGGTFGEGYGPHAARALIGNINAPPLPLTPREIQGLGRVRDNVDLTKVGLRQAQHDAMIERINTMLERGTFL